MLTMSVPTERLIAAQDFRYLTQLYKEGAVVPPMSAALYRQFARKGLVVTEREFKAAKKKTSTKKKSKHTTSKKSERKKAARKAA